MYLKKKHKLILHLLFWFSERNWNMWIPGFGSEELKPYKKAATTEAHKQVQFHML